MASGSAMARLTQADRVYVGWRYAQVHPDPGPPPGVPEPAERPPAGPPARRPGEHLAAHPLRLATGGTFAGVALFLACGIAGLLPWAFAGVALLACERPRDRKSTRLNSSHVEISYAVFC